MPCQNTDNTNIKEKANGRNRRKNNSLNEGKKLSRKGLAIMAGVTEAALSRYINNERQPKVEILANIATALNTTSDYLINGKTEETDFAEIYRFVARGAKNMDKDEKMKLMRLLLDD